MSALLIFLGLVYFLIYFEFVIHQYVRGSAESNVTASTSIDLLRIRSHYPQCTAGNGPHLGLAASLLTTAACEISAGTETTLMTCTLVPDHSALASASISAQVKLIQAPGALWVKHTQPFISHFINK